MSNRTFIYIFHRFNLMAVVPDRRIALTHKLKMLKTNKAIVTAALEKLLMAQTKSAGLISKQEPIHPESDDKLNVSIKIESDRPSINATDREKDVKKDIKSEPDSLKDPPIAVEPDKKKDDSSDISILRRLSMQNQTETTSTESSDLKTSSTEEKAAAPKPSLEANAFTIKDLSNLLKNLESEIALNEQHLNDENDKRYMFKVDDCRRTHNYDDFICTFLSMLAQQGVLGELVSQHLILPRKSVSSFNNNNNRVSRVPYKKSTQKTTSTGKRRKGRNKGTKKK